MNEEQFEKDLQSLHIKDNWLYDQALYAALCNMKWVHKETGFEYSCSWRYAGSLIAEMRGNHEPMNYLKFYCSGFEEGNVSEGVVRDDIKHDLSKLGWEPKSWEIENDDTYLKLSSE